jgi:oligopeptide transport system substrate-binding protein
MLRSCLTRRPGCARYARALAGSALLWTLGTSALAADPVRLGNPGEPQTLDPHRYNLRLEETLLNDLFLGLTTFNAEGELVPGVAREWRVSDDGLVWTFTLDTRQRWSDGQPVTADDFVFAFRRLQSPETAASLSYFMYPLKNAAAVNAGRLPAEALGVRALAPDVLELTLEAPYPFLLERLLYPTAYPLPRHVLAAHGDDWVKPENWVSNGAYTLADWRPQAYVRLTANPHYPEPPAVSEVFYYPLASEQSAFNRYRAGEVDAIGSFPAGELDEVRSTMGADLRISPQLSIIYLVFNTREPPFSDPRVREALALVVDPQVITDKVQKSGNIASKSFVPALVEGYEPVEMPLYALDPPERRARALTLLAEAGYTTERPLEVTLRYISGEEAKRTALAIAAFWKSLPVVVRLHQAELKVHFADLRQGDFQVAQAGWIGENNAEHYLGLLVSDTGDVNYGGFADPRFDELMAAARAEPEVAERNRRLRLAEARAAPLYPVVPLYSVSVRRLVNPRLRGWHENLRDIHPARYLSFETAP